MHSLDYITSSRLEYRLKASQKLIYLAYAALFIIGAGFFFKLATSPNGEFAFVIAFCLVIPGLILVSLALRSRLVLEGTRMEIRSALRTFTASRNDIVGLRRISDQYGNRTRVYLENSGGAFNVSDSFTGNEALNEWLTGLPDLDERDAAEIKQEVSSQYHQGPAGNEQLNSFKRAKTWAILLSVATGLASIPVLYANYAPVHATAGIVLVLFPLLGIILLRWLPLLFTIFKRKIDPRADLGVVIMWPGVAMLLSYKTGSDVTHLVDFFSLSYWILLVLVCYVAALFRVAWENPSRWGVLAGLVTFGGMYGIGLINTANTVPDRSVPQFYRTRVLGMYETHGKGASSYFRLAPWGPMNYADDVDVPKRIYEQAKVGDQICLGLHPGFLHAPFYSLLQCPEQSSKPTPQVQ